MEHLVSSERSQRALVIGEIWASLTNQCPFYTRYKLSLDQKFSLDRKVTSRQHLSFELKLIVDLKRALFRFKDSFRWKGMPRPAQCFHTLTPIFQCQKWETLLYYAKNSK